MKKSDPVLPEEPHDEAEELLPWYATGQLDADERELVETHLAACAHCRDQLVLERRTIRAFRSFSPQVEYGWKRMRERLIVPTRDPVGPATTLRQAAAELWAALRRPAVLAFAAAQVAVLIFASGLLLWLSRPAYRALGTSNAPASANVIVMFRDGSTERNMREALRTAGASIVDGPTAAGAYLAHVEPQRRAVALKSLQSDDMVQMAQPIDRAESQ